MSDEFDDAVDALPPRPRPHDVPATAAAPPA